MLRLKLLLSCALLILLAEASSGFALLVGVPAAAGRWNAAPGLGAGLYDGLQVGVDAGFAESFGLTDAGEIADFEAALVQSFRVWETPDLQFDIQFDVAGGREIQLSATDSSHPFIAGTTFTGVMSLDRFVSSQNITLTSGAVQRGTALLEASIFIATDRFNGLFSLLVGAGLAQPEDYGDRLINLMAHEIGHAIGLSHPNESATYDDDDDPLTLFVPADPNNPAADLARTFNRDPRALMRGSGQVDFLATQLRPDDRSGLNFLYPVPEARLLVLLGAAGLALRRRRTRLPWLVRGSKN